MPHKEAIMPRQSRVFVGAVFGKITVTKDLGIRGRDRWWSGLCACGNVVERTASNMASGSMCYECCHDGSSSRTHGRRKSAEYAVWNQMKNRCLNRKSNNFHRYGGRGIRVCARWMSFANFFADMGKKPSRDHQIERINNDGNYTPSNCRWATRKEQARNRVQNRFLTFQGQTMCLLDWAEKLKIKMPTLAMRLKLGWSIKRAFTQPVKLWGR